MIGHVKRLLPVLYLLVLGGVQITAVPADESPKPVSYERDIRPIFQSHCQGCHQPAKPSGGLVMTSLSSLLLAGDSEQPAVVPGEAEQSYLLEQITPVGGEAAMPQNAPPLSEQQIDLIRRWIAAGATDDTPPGARPIVDAHHPPEYVRPPVIASLDYSPMVNCWLWPVSMKPCCTTLMARAWSRG